MAISIDEAASFLTPLRHMLFQHRQLEIKNSGQALTVIGGGQVIDTLLDQIAPSIDGVKSMGSVHTFGLTRTIATAGEQGDLVLARIPRRLPLSNLGPRLPEWIGAVAPVDAIFDKGRGRESMVKKSMRLVRRRNYQARLSSKIADFHLFYDEFYLPFIQARFGPLALVRSRDALAKRFAKGFVMFIDGPDGCVAGDLLERNGRVLRKLVFGSTLDPSLVAKFRLHGISHLLATQTARDLGCSHLDFGGSLPLVSDGRLCSKFGWTAGLAKQRYVRWDVLLHWRFPGERVQSILAAGPIFVNGRGNFDLVAGPGATLPQASFARRNIGRVWVGDDTGTMPMNPKAWPLTPAPLSSSIDLMKHVQSTGASDEDRL